MRIAIIDNCQTTLNVYSDFIKRETGARVDCFHDPLNFIATSARKYDVIISDYYFEKVNLDFYWDYLTPETLIILSAALLDDTNLNCLGIFKKSSVHSRGNIISLIKILGKSKTPGPFLHLAPLK